MIANRSPAAWQDPTLDPTIERRIRQVALPLALGLAFLVTGSALRGVARTFLTMWVHELGHAVAAWLCGFGAFPGPWFTPVSEDRVLVVTAGGLAAIGYGGYRAWAAGSKITCAALALLALAQLALTFCLRPHAARAFIVFGGDAGCLVLGTLLMATLYVRPGTALHRGWLRWGFLVIGAFAYADTFRTWWTAGHSSDGVIFGENVGRGDSDPTVLAYQYGWSEARLVARHMTVAWACLMLLIVLYVVMLARESRFARRD